jgi:L-cystine transport system permease protein
MKINFDFSFFLYEITIAFSYVPIVLMLSVLPLLAGSLFGGTLALSRIFRVRGIQYFARAYVVINRSIPLLLQMFLAYNFVKGIYVLLGWNTAGLNKFAVVLISLSLNAAGFLSEGIRSAFLSVESGQFEAGYSVGMTTLQTVRWVLLPQCLPVAIPILGSAFIMIIKGSSAAYLLGVVELIQGTAMKTAGNFRYLEAYCAAALIYWGMTIVVERLFFFLEKRSRLHIKGGIS